MVLLPVLASKRRAYLLLPTAMVRPLFSHATAYAEVGIVRATSPEATSQIRNL